MYIYQIIENCSMSILLDISTLLYSANSTNSESYLNVLVACLVHDRWSVEDELFNLMHKNVYTQMRL